MLRAWVDCHELRSPQIEPLKDLACGFFAQLARHVRIAPQRPERLQIATRPA
jgi:hypothetical protein